jgi:hypothetical protein
MIAEGFARLPRDDRFKCNALSVIRSLIDHNLALTVSLRDLIGEFAKQCPIQAREWRVIEMALDNGANVSEMTIAMCGGLVELTAAANGTIAIVVGMAHEFPPVRHFGNLPRLSLRFGMEYEQMTVYGLLRICQQTTMGFYGLFAAESISASSSTNSDSSRIES